MSSKAKYDYNSKKLLQAHCRMDSTKSRQSDRKQVHTDYGLRRANAGKWVENPQDYNEGRSQDYCTPGRQGKLFRPGQVRVCDQGQAGLPVHSTHPAFLREQVGIMKATGPITL